MGTLPCIEGSGTLLGSPAHLCLGPWTPLFDKLFNKPVSSGAESAQVHWDQAEAA